MDTHTQYLRLKPRDGETQPSPVTVAALGVNAIKAEPGSTPVVRVRDLPAEVGFFQNETELECRTIRAGKARNRALIETDDVILVARGGQLRVGIATPGMEGAVITNNLLLIRTNPAILLGPVLAAWLGTPRGQHELMKCSRSSSAIMMSLKTADVLDLKVPVPPMEVQEHITKLLWESSLAHREAIAAAELRLQMAKARCAELLGGAA